MPTPKAAKTPPAPAQAKTAYLVLGMHRSGTSAVTRLLALAGAELPANVMPGDEHNAKGYFEPWKIAILNDERLRAGGGAWDDIFAFPYRQLLPAEEAQWRARAAALFAQEYGDVAHPLLKDPRVTVLMPMWRGVLEALGIGVRCVIPVRSPLAVAGSLARRDGFAPQKSVLIWTAYMLAAEAYSRDLPCAFVGFDALLADWRATVQSMEVSHGAPLPALTAKAGKAIDRFLAPELRHNTGDGTLAALGWAGELAASVEQWFNAAAAGARPDRKPLDDAAAELARRQAEIGVLISPLTRDHDIARTELIQARDQAAALREAYDAAMSRQVELEKQLELVEGVLVEADLAADAILAYG
jgi:hypothetical protein